MTIEEMRKWDRRLLAGFKGEKDPTQIHPLEALEGMVLVLIAEISDIVSETIYHGLYTKSQELYDLIAEVREEIKGWESLVAELQAETEEFEGQRSSDPHVF